MPLRVQYTIAATGKLPEEPWEIEDTLDDSAFHRSNAQLIEYAITNGNIIRVYVGGQDRPLRFPTGFALVQCEGDLDGDELPDTSDKDIDGDGLSNVVDACVVNPVGSPACVRLL